MGLYKILVIDDEINVINAIKRILNSHNYELDATTDPIEAFDLIKQNQYDIIITDQRMPKVRGIEILKFAMKVSRDSIRILVTGYSEIDTVISAINEGNVYRYITKPWDNEEFIRIIEDAIIHKEKQNQSKQMINELMKDNQKYGAMVRELAREIGKTEERITNTLLKIINREMRIFICIQKVFINTLYTLLSL